VWGEERCIQGLGVGNLREGDHLKDPNVDGDNIKMDLREVGWGHGVNRSGSGWGQVAGYWEGGNEPSGFIKRGELE
jgi:hypothetical protein